MAKEYPNVYYEQLEKMVIEKPSLSMKPGEVCFYEGTAKSYRFVTKPVQEKPKKKTSFFLTPFFVGLKRVKETVVNEVTNTEYAKGKLYITNMRVIFKCKIDAFDLFIPSITKIDQHSDGIRVNSNGKSYDVMTSDLKQVLYVFELINKAQTDSTETSITNDASQNMQQSANTSRNDDYAIAAFIHYCEFSGQPLGKNKDSYPRYFAYEFHVNDPLKYHKKVIEEGYLEIAPLENLLNRMKVDELKQILLANKLSDKGKKSELIARILENVDATKIERETIYVPSSKGVEHLSKYEYLFKIKRYGITPKEFELQKSKQNATAKTNDIIWQILNDKFNEYNISKTFSLARNELLHKAYLLDDEGRFVDSLSHYILVLYYDMSGCENGGHLCEKDDLMLAPGIIKSIFDKKEYFKAEMIDRCYGKYTLPHHYLSKDAFNRLLNAIFNDETVDLAHF